MSLAQAYELAGVHSPLALSNFYSEEEQVLFIERTWDYDNPDQLHNKIKKEVEEENLDNLTEEEREWCKEILWFWHHHAISCAFWKNDKAAAQLHAAQALKYQGNDHPNKITRLLFYLVHDELDNAVVWAKTITDKDEGPTAADCIELYKQGLFFGPPS